MQGGQTARHDVARRARSTTCATFRGQRGFTLVEVLLCLTILGMVAVAVGTISLSGTVSVADSSTERHLDGATAQFVARVFSRDVEGASKLGASDCGSTGSALVTFVGSIDGTLTTYRNVTADGDYSLVRARCSATGVLRSARTVTDELSDPVTVSCAPAAIGCSTGDTPPRTVTLSVSRTAEFSFSVDGARRPSSEAVAPVLPAHLFALGGTTPLSLNGNAELVVNGNAYVNSTSSGAITLSGNHVRLTATSSLEILSGGGCTGCNADKVTPFPVGSYPVALADPLAYLPAPDENALAAGFCASGVCHPGIYSQALNITGDTTFQSGTYVFRKGLSISGNGTVTGANVLLFNGCGLNAPSGCTNSEGGFSISGQAAVNFTPLTSGRYEGVLYFQSRTNTSNVSISGGSQLQSFKGTLYAPSSNGVDLGAGGGGLALEAVVGRNLSISGNGTVTING